MRNKLFLLCIFWVVLSCREQQFDDTSFLSSSVGAKDLTLSYNTLKDNKGTTVFTPKAKGVLFYTIDFGDGSKRSKKISPGSTITHHYGEGSYKVILHASNALGKITAKTFNLNIVYQSPKNVKVTVTSDATIAKKVNVNVTADFASSYEVYFGEVGKDTPVKATIGNTASYTYKSAGTYNLRIVVKGKAKAPYRGS